MLLAQRPPSWNWEPLPLDPSGQYAAWIWFRPPAVPGGVMIVIPAGLSVDPRLAAALSVRQLVALAGLEVAQVLGWSINGVAFDAAGGTSPMLDQPIPPSSPPADVQLTIWMQVPQEIALPAMMPMTAAAVYQMPAQSSGPVSALDEQYMAAIEMTWNGIRQLETKVGSIRNQLEQTISRLNSLNRDLSPEERRASDNKDTKDWFDARRWLRDSLATLSRFVKEIDMGTTSGAGQRHYFEDLYRQFIVPRIPFAGLEQAVVEFESHAKSLQNLVASTQAGLSRAGRDAEQRANGVLMRISAKSRSGRRKE